MNPSGAAWCLLTYPQERRGYGWVTLRQQPVAGARNPGNGLMSPMKVYRPPTPLWFTSEPVAVAGAS
ncbi:hypothetical protein DFJ65_1864 [Calidifontibacter indicus]|uniref:Uncharacterized protein n=1 Tax=Calidifontibacter indicus TaxID=419650 RepID=A0A3D9UN11_9MICO|nr:hypothetical protein DFJ65_1864 [Calidifontibacter indicus]